MVPVASSKLAEDRVIEHWKTKSQWLDEWNCQFCLANNDVDKNGVVALDSLHREGDDNNTAKYFKTTKRGRFDKVVLRYPLAIKCNDG